MCLTVQAENAKRGIGPLISCDGCQYARPEMDQANNEIWHIWGLIRTQFRTGGFGPTGLDFSAAKEILDVHAVDVTPALFRKIRLLEDLTIAASRKAAETKNPKGGT